VRARTIGERPFVVVRQVMDTIPCPLAPSLSLFCSHVIYLALFLSLSTSLPLSCIPSCDEGRDSIPCPGSEALDHCPRAVLGRAQKPADRRGPPRHHEGAFLSAGGALHVGVSCRRGPSYHLQKNTEALPRLFCARLCCVVCEA
jgi:hypothetical protein